MRTILRIMKTELRVLFFSPIAWIILIVFALQVGFQYIDSIDNILRSQLLGYPPSRITTSIFGGFSGLATRMLKNLYLYIPLLTMGIMSRELSSGSIKLLYSSPISNFKIIIGKYLSVIVYGLLLIGIMCFPVIITSISIKSADIPLMISGLFGVYLTIIAYGAIGLFMSTITKYQVVAAIGTLAMLAILNSIGSIGQDINLIRDLTYWLSITERSQLFIDGMICSKDIIYFLLVIFLFITLAIIRLQGERLKQSKVKVYSKYGMIVIVILFLGYITSLPSTILYYDVTRTKVNTLTAESQRVLSQIDDEITITSYVNLFDDTYSKGMPSKRNSDKNRFNRYYRFKPGIKFNYVYYYGEGGEQYTRYKNAYPNLDHEGLLKRICKIYDYNEKDFLTVEEASKIDNLAGEGGKMMRVIERKNGSKSRLRLYNDDYVHPHEEQITTAFKRLIMKSPVVAFITGHKERGSSDYGEKGYGSFANNITFRYSLVNNGFDVINQSLNTPIDKDIDIIVLSDMKSEMTETELTNFNEFISRGGNAFILGEPKRQKFMNPVIEQLGLRFSDGIVVSPTKQYFDDVVVTTATTEVATISEQLETLRRKGYSIVTPSTCAINIIDTTKGFQMKEVLKSAARGSWIEYETTDFLNTKSTLGENEIEESNVIMYYLTRNINDKEQRIFVIGDADCISTLELSTQRPGIISNNFNVITGIFSNLSYGEFPVYAPREREPDNELYITKTTLPIVKYTLIAVIPALIFILGALLLFKRNRK